MRHHNKTAIRPNVLLSLTSSVSPPAALLGPQGSAVVGFHSRRADVVARTGIRHWGRNKKYVRCTYTWVPVTNMLKVMTGLHWI